MDKMHVLFVMVAGILNFAASQTTLSNQTLTINTPKTDYDRCEAYCDRLGLWHDSQRCSSQAPYCCGTTDMRYCCGDRKLRTNYKPAMWCRSWWQWQWRVVVGMLLSLTIMLFVVGCCYYCCAGDRVSRTTSSNRGRHRDRGDTESGDVPSTNNSLPRQPSQGFNPQSPFAFEPPPYETLPIDPPKYSDIFIVGECNMAYVGEPDTEGMDNGEVLQPPAYSQEEHLLDSSGNGHGCIASSSASQPLVHHQGETAREDTGIARVQRISSSSSGASLPPPYRQDGTSCVGPAGDIPTHTGDVHVQTVSTAPSGASQPPAYWQDESQTGTTGDITTATGDASVPTTSTSGVPQSAAYKQDGTPSEATVDTPTHTGGAGVKTASTSLPAAPQPPVHKQDRTRSKTIVDTPTHTGGVSIHRPSVSSPGASLSSAYRQDRTRSENTVEPATHAGGASIHRLSISSSWASPPPLFGQDGTPVKTQADACIQRACNPSSRTSTEPPAQSTSRLSSHNTLCLDTSDNASVNSPTMSSRSTDNSDATFSEAHRNARRHSGDAHTLSTCTLAPVHT